MAGCSAVVDFDRGRIPGTGDGGADGSMSDGSGADGSVDGGPGEGGRDAGDSGMGDATPGDGSMDAEAGPGDGGDAGGLCDLDTHAGCDDDELCCMTSAGPACEATDPAAQCAACDAPCDGVSASACGGRTCLCGSSPECSGAEPFCDASAGLCLGCQSDGDCDDNDDGAYCVGGACVECDRGEDPDDTSDDEGCEGAAPICNADNQCVGCTNTPDNCPGELDCVAGEGCIGCDLDAPVGDNDCPAGTPICQPAGSGVGNTCVRCASNDECPVYCDEPNGSGSMGGGSCYSTCDPDDNAGCSTREENFCLATSSTVATCVGCDEYGPSVCTGDTPECNDRTTGPLRGACVECLVNGHCPGGAEPACDQTSYTCRGCAVGTEATDCTMGGLSACDGSTGRCVECTDNGDCSTGRPQCDTDSNTCVECLTAGDCETVTDVCSGGECVPCSADSDCGASHPVGAQCVDRDSRNECRACDPDENQCTGSQVCNPLTFSCMMVDCTRDQDCDTGGAGPETTPFCNTESNRCEPCTARGADADDDCGPGQVCSREGASLGACGECDPADALPCGQTTTPICDEVDLTCGACAGNCPDGTFCDDVGGGSAGGCYETCDPDNHEGCDPPNDFCVVQTPGVSAACVGCDDPAVSCSGDLVCNTSTGECVECTGGAEGGGPGLCDLSDATPYCRPSDGTCQPCDEAPSSFCSGVASGYFCGASGRCVGCEGPSDCDTTEPVCDGALDECRACEVATQSADCPTTGARVCASSGACVECTADSDAACTGSTPECETTGDLANTCVECRIGESATDCTTDPTRPICGDDNTCRACSAGECGAGEMCMSGECVSAM